MILARLPLLEGVKASSAFETIDKASILSWAIRAISFLGIEWIAIYSLWKPELLESA